MASTGILQMIINQTLGFAAAGRRRPRRALSLPPGQERQKTSRCCPAWSISTWTTRSLSNFGNQLHQYALPYGCVCLFITFHVFNINEALRSFWRVHCPYRPWDGQSEERRFVLGKFEISVRLLTDPTTLHLWRSVLSKTHKLSLKYSQLCRN